MKFSLGKKELFIISHVSLGAYFLLYSHLRALGFFLNTLDFPQTGDSLALNLFGSDLSNQFHIELLDFSFS